jgi:hypothetical protein
MSEHSENNAEGQPIAPVFDLMASSTPRPSCIPPSPDGALSDDSRAWLDHIPAALRSTVANFFHYAVRAGHRTPEAVLAAIRDTCHRRIQGGRDQDGSTVLHALQSDQAGALAYAAYVLAYEALSPDARRQVKAERAIAYLKTTMAGKSPTLAQLSYLASLGYRGAPPKDRAAASALIDQLRQRKEV